MNNAGYPMFLCQLRWQEPVGGPQQHNAGAGQHRQQESAILSDAGSQLAGLTAKVVSRLTPKSPHAPVAMTGSVFRQSTEVRHVFYNCLHARFPGIEIRDELVEPFEGALTLARRAGKTEKSV